MSKHTYVEKPCEICGKIIRTRKDKPSKTCSYECMGILRKRTANLYRVCLHCGKDFVAKKQTNIFCSNRCSANHRNKDKKKTIRCNQCRVEFERPNCHIGERNFCSKECVDKYSVENKTRLAENSSNWKGGQRMQDGYIFTRVQKGKYIANHRLIMENEIGRTLSDDEIVHHIDKNKLNNRIENLQIVTRAEHIEIHRDSLYPQRDEAINRGKIQREVVVIETY